MIRYARHLLVLLALTGATPAFAQSWHVAAMSGAKPDRTVYLLDTDSIARTGDMVRFTTQSVFEKLTDTRDFDRSVTRREGNCATMSSTIVENTYYAGGSYQNNDATRGNTIAHKENTIMYSVLAQACGKRQIEQGTVANPEAAVRAYFAQ
jgi:hypothetical protein